VEYKLVKKIEEEVAIACGDGSSLWRLKDSGTYGFYRVAASEILFDRGVWLPAIRAKLANLSDEFWKGIREAVESKMEHYLSDLGAALFANDDYFYLVSLANFIKMACLTLFCINKRFEPSHHYYRAQVTSLAGLPASFATQLEIMLSRNSTVTADRKYSIACLIARGIALL
jgi:hypothetical protein